MKNNWFSKGSKFYPLVALLALCVLQFIHAQISLQSFRNRADRDNEILRERMEEEDIPSNIKEHIIYVQRQSTYGVDSLVNSLSFMQIFTLWNILLVFYNFISKKSGKSDGDK